MLLCLAHVDRLHKANPVTEYVSRKSESLRDGIFKYTIEGSKDTTVAPTSLDASNTFLDQSKQQDPSNACTLLHLISYSSAESDV